MRPIVVALAAVLAVPVVVVAGGAPHPGRAGATTATAIGAQGRYRPVARVRALDTRTSGRIPAHATARVRVTGLGEVPSTNVVAISVNLSVLTPASSGSLSAFADGTSWSGATMSFRAGQTIQNFETVPVSSGGLIDIRNNTSTSLALLVDILGYHLRPDPADPYTSGRYQPMTPARLLDTRTGQPVTAGQTRTIPMAGRAGIPSSGSIGVVVTFTVLSPSRSGSLTVGAGNLAKNTPSISFTAGQTEQSQLLMALDANGALPIRNNSAAGIQVIADVVGYYPDLYLYSFFAADRYVRAYDSRTSSMPLQPGHEADVGMWNTAWAFVDTSQDPFAEPPYVNAASINVTVLNPTVTGSISIRPADLHTSWDGAATISFTAGHTKQRMLMARASLGEDFGGVRIRNNSATPITLIVDLDGVAAYCTPGC